MGGTGKRMVGSYERRQVGEAGLLKALESLQICDWSEQGARGQPASHNASTNYLEKISQT